MRASFFASLGAGAVTPWEGQWVDLCAYLQNPPEYPTKAACPLLKLATFGDTRTEKGSLRHDANVTAIYGIEGDHDASTMSPEEAVLLLQQAGIEALIYTSPSHTPATPRWRVLAPTSQLYAPAAHRELVGRLNAVLRSAFSSESFALSQAYYYGKVAGVTYAAYRSQGTCTDLVPGLVAVFPNGNAVAANRAESFDLSAAPDPEWNGPTDDADLIRRALASRSAANTFGNKASFADLWECNTERLRVAFPDPSRLYDESAADAALIAHLSFWTGRHGERIERLMRQSALKRDKWEREDYLPRTIANVLARGGDVLKDKLPEPPSSPIASPEAPIQRMVEGATFLSPVQQQELFKGCVYVQDQHRILAPGGRLLKPDQFRASYGGYVFAMDDANQKTSRSAWEAFTESQALRAPIADSVAFRPDLTPGCIIEQEGRSYANTWWPANPARKVGDASIFTRHMELLFPDERDRTIMWCYMAACVQHPGVKFQWCPVVQGPEGNGKTVLSWAVAAAVGQRYTHWIDARGIDSEFNAWIDGKLLICIEELRAQEHAEEVIEKLKTYITGGAGVQIQKKGVDQYTTQIVANFIANTNHKSAIRKTPDNARRFAVFFAPHQTKEAMQAAGMTGEYFQRLYNWLKQEDGFAIVSELLHTRGIPDEFNPATKMQRAPDTSTTDQVIRESMGSVEQHIAEAIDQGLPGFMGGWVSTVMLEKLLEERGLSGKISLNRRRDMMVAMGYVLHPGLADGRVNNPVQPDGRKPQLFVRRGSPLEFMTGAAEIAKKYSQDQQISLART